MVTVPGVILQSWSNISTDLAILGIGITIIRKLQFKREERSGLWIVAAVGSLSIVATLIRFIFSFEAARRPGEDVLDLVNNVYRWSALEIFFAFLAFFLPCLRALVNRWRAGKDNATSHGYSIKSSRNRDRLRNGPGDITVLTSFDVRSAKAESQTELHCGNGVNFDSFGRNESDMSTAAGIVPRDNL